MPDTATSKVEASPDYPRITNPPPEPGGGSNPAFPVSKFLAFRISSVSSGRCGGNQPHRTISMPAMSRYDQNCPVARTLEIIGERWTILILRDLFTKGALRFNDLEQSLAGVSPNTLSLRLKELEENGIVERHFYEQHPPRAEYLLTKKGRALGPVLRELKGWGEKHTRKPSPRKS